MNEENKATEINESDVVKAVKEEFVQLFNKQKEDFDNKLKEIEKKNVENIRAIIAGRKFELPEDENEENNDEDDFETTLYNGLRKKFKLEKEKEE